MHHQPHTSRTARYRELMSRERSLDVAVDALGYGQEAERRGIGQEMWSLRAGLAPSGWCAHCAEPVYDHEPMQVAVDGVYCARHARTASHEVEFLTERSAAQVEASEKARLQDWIMTLRSWIAKRGDFSLALAGDHEELRLRVR
jgi:hypothetical protein